MSLSNYPPGVSGNEPMITGGEDFEFACPTCGEELMFNGDRWDASADCPKCGEVWVTPEELLQSAADEQARDAAQDARFE